MLLGGWIGRGQHRVAFDRGLATAVLGVAVDDIRTQADNAEEGDGEDDRHHSDGAAALEDEIGV